MKNLIKCICFVCLCLTFIFMIYKVLSWKDTSGAYISVTEQLANTPKDTIDVVFVGSSHVYTSVYPAYLWKEHGIAAFDLSLSEQDKYCSYYSLKELLKTQSPKVVCLEMYGLMLDGHSKIGDAYRNVLALKTSKNSIELAKASSEENFWDYVLRWPIVHTRYRELGKYDFIDNEINEYSRGAVMGWGDGAGYMDPNVIAIKESTKLSDENRKWLDSFVDLADEYDFELIFFVAPDYEYAEEKMIYNGARDYAKLLDIEFIEFNELTKEMGFNPANDMGDLVHCNADGAAKISSYFGNILDDDYHIRDRRGNDKYEQWDRDLALLDQVIQEHSLLVTYENDDYLDILQESHDLTVILSLDGNFDEGDREVLIPFGIAMSDSVNGGKWVYCNGQVQKIMDNNPGQSHLYEADKYDVFKIQCMPEGADTMSNILLGLEQMMSTENGLNIVVYDNITKTVISKYGRDY